MFYLAISGSLEISVCVNGSLLNMRGSRIHLRTFPKYYRDKGPHCSMLEFHNTCIERASVLAQ